MLTLSIQWDGATAGALARHLLDTVGTMFQKAVAWSLLAASIDLWIETDPPRPGYLAERDSEFCTLRLNKLDIELIWPLDDGLFSSATNGKRSTRHKFLVCPPNTDSVLTALREALPVNCTIQSLDNYLNWRCLWATLHSGTSREQSIRRLIELFNHHSPAQHRVQLVDGALSH